MGNTALLKKGGKMPFGYAQDKIEQHSLFRELYLKDGEW